MEKIKTENYATFENKTSPNLVTYKSVRYFKDEKPLFPVVDKTINTNSLKYWANTVNETEKFVPRRGQTIYCKKCPFDKPCSKWKDWEQEA